MSRPNEVIASGNVVLGADQPIDDLTAHTMQTIARKGRGFVLGTAPTIAGVDPVRLVQLRGKLAKLLATENVDKAAVEEASGGLLPELHDALLGIGEAGISIEVKESLPPHDEYEPPAAYRDHVIRDTDSFIDYAKRYGTKDNSLVLFGTETATLVINEFVLIGERETVEMPFIASPDWQAWSNVLNRPMTHKELLQFLMRQEHNLTEGGVLASMQSLRLNSQINLESDIRDDGNSIGFTVKTSAGDELKKFPKKFDLVIPILEQDVDGDRWSKATVRLNIVLPTEAKQGPTFTLYCSEWPQILIRRIKQEGEAIRLGLPDWTVVHGTYAVAERRLGE